MTGLTKENCSTIGFVESCYLSDAINTAELNEWAEHIMISSSGYPDYIVDLCEFNGPRFHFYRVLGFTPSRELSETEDKAVSGITYLRGREVIDGPSKRVALRALSSCPHIMDEFNATFPFIRLPGQG